MKKILRLFHVLLLGVIFTIIKVEGWGQASVDLFPNMGAKPSVVPDFGNVYINHISDYKYFTLFGANLNSNVTVGPLAGYNFSVTPDGIYTSSVTVSPSAGKIKQYIYITFSPDDVKAYNSSISVIGGGAISFNVPVSGTGITNNVPTNAVLAKLSIQLLADDEGDVHSVDGLKVVFDEKFSAAIGDEDSFKFTNKDENLAINRDGTMLSIEGRPLITATDTLPLLVWQLQQKKYYLKFVASDFSPLLTAFIRDEYLNTETPVSLSSTTYIPFIYDAASFVQNRFSILLKTAGLLPVTLTDVRAYQKEKGIKIDWSSLTEINIGSYEVEKSIIGQHFEKVANVQPKGNNAVAQSYTWFDANVNQGNNFYRIKVTEKSRAVKYSQVVKVDISKGSSSITVFPNPVKGNVIGLQMSNLDRGNYTISLYSNSAQKFYSGIIEHRGGSATYSLPTGRQISKGIYSLHINNGETVINRMVIVE